MPIRARLYIALILAAGTLGLAEQVAHFRSQHPIQFWCYFLLPILPSGLKIRLRLGLVTSPGNFLFILVGIVQFSLPEAIVLGVAGTVVQCLWRPRSFSKAVRIAFSACSIGMAVMAAHVVFHGPLNGMLGELHPLLLGLAACAYFVVNTALVAGVIALTERKSIYKTW